MRRGFLYVAIFNFLMIVGICGGIEHNSIGLLPGIFLILAFLPLMILFAYLGGLFYEE